MKKPEREVKKKQTPLQRAAARKLGLDNPQGQTAFLSSFKSSLPPTDDGKDTYALIKEELVSRLSR